MNQQQINMMFGASSDLILRYIQFLGYDLEYDTENNGVINRAKTFQISNLARLDIAEDILTVLEESKRTGKGMKWFIEQLEPTLKAKGWWNSYDSIDPETGEIITNVIEKNVGSPSRLALIYENVTNATYTAAHYVEMMKTTELYPYWIYIAVMDSRTRPAHAKLSQKVFRYDDPIWDIIFPPNGHRCRCDVESLSEEDVKQKGLTVLKSSNTVSRNIVDYIDENGETVYKTESGVTFIDENGDTIEFFSGAGFSGNPANAFYKLELERYNTELAQAYIDAELNSEMLDVLYTQAAQSTETQDAITIAALDKQYAQDIGLESPVLAIEQSTILTQLQNKTLLSIDHVRTIQQRIIDADLVAHFGDSVLFFSRNSGGTWRIVSVNKSGTAHFIADMTNDNFLQLITQSTIVKGTL